jgi:cellulose synthase/poly-beta-1,6-N-acetylglucosamine synthase-like glycosyltransferase
MKLTVAIPSYHRPADLRRALDALTRQERPVDGVIVVARKNDAETHAVVREFLSVLPLDLQLVEKPGMVEANNRALDQATGDVISFTDDDAAPHPDWVRRIVQTFEDHPDLAGLGGRDHVFQHNGWIEGEEPVVGIVHWYGRAIGYHHLGVGPRRAVDILKGVNMSFRMEAVGRLRMDQRLRGTGAQWHCDMKLCLDLRAQGKRLAYDPSIVVDHFPAERQDEDQRDCFNPVAYENQIHNLTLTLLEYLRPAGRMILLSYALAVGIGNGYCGLLKGLLHWPMIGNEAWRKVAASARGVCAAWKTWMAGKNIPG